jgi:hypothetical protein
MKLAVIRAPLDWGDRRPINWAAYQACGTVVPPRAAPRKGWGGFALIVGIVALIGVPMLLQMAS